MQDNIQDRINQYLKDTIAAERNFENALATFSKAGEQTTVQSMLSAASAKAKNATRAFRGAPCETRRHAIGGKDPACGDVGLYASERSDWARRSRKEHAASHGYVRGGRGRDGDV